MKIKLEELKHALSWIESNCNKDYIEIIQDQRTTFLSCIDRMDRVAKIELWSTEINNMPKLTKTEILPKPKV